uniref:Uncharacterized protein n=1 Tax=Fusarium oxysporum (strain Fo5176) TaxID=660025 RepID=A0A0D2XXW7_FUSOF
MANEATATGANTIPLGTGSEGSSGRAGAPPKTPNLFSPSPVSMGPRPKRVWQPHLPLFSSESLKSQEQAKRPVLITYLFYFEHNLGPGGPLIVVERQGHGKMLVFQDQKLESLKGVRGLLVPVSTNTPTRRPLAGGISGQPELDTLVASWNKVVARRFCQMHKGYFENGDWATTENRNQKGLQYHELQGDHLRPQLKNDKNQLIRTQNRTLLEKLEELGPRSERRPRNNHDSYHRPLTRRFRSNWYFESDKMRVTAISRSPDLVKKEQQPMGDFLDPDFGLGGGDNLYSTSVAR